MCSSLMLKPRSLHEKILGAHLISFDLHHLCQCAMQKAPPQTLKMLFFTSYVNSIVVCHVRKFQNEHWTVLNFPAIFPSAMMQSLLLLLCDLVEIAFSHELPFR
jgi:hypothetical protein